MLNPAVGKIAMFQNASCAGVQNEFIVLQIQLEIKLYPYYV